MWLPFDQLALSCQDQVCVFRLDGNSFWSGLLNSVSLTVKAPKFCLVRKLMGARSKPKRTSFVKLEVGLQCQAVETKFSLSLLKFGGTASNVFVRPNPAPGRSRTSRFQA